MFKFQKNVQAKVKQNMKLNSSLSNNTYVFEYNCIHLIKPVHRIHFIFCFIFMYCVPKTENVIYFQNHVFEICDKHLFPINEMESLTVGNFKCFSLP